MKRCLVSLTSLLLAVALTACGSSGSQEAAQAPTEETEASAQATDDVKEDDLEATDSSSASEETGDDSSNEAEPAEKEEEFERGTIDGDTYRSEFFGISYTLPEDYEFATDEQLAEMANITTDMLEDEASQKALESGRVLFDMYAYAPDGQNISITIEKANALTGVLISVDQYREICISKLDGQLEGTGMEVTAHDDTTYRIGDTDYPAENIVLSYEGTEIFEKLVFLKNGSIFGIMPATDSSLEAAEQLLSHCAEI